MMKKGYIYHYLLLASLGAFVLDTVREGVKITSKAEEKREFLRKRQLLNDRLLAITRDTWPECVNLRMTAEACKQFIDEEIFADFTDQDQYIRSVIMDKRRKSDQLYNAVSILMNDDDMVIGRDGDGLVYYDFTWDGTGEPATDEQQTAIPPILAMEPDASLDPLGLDPENLPATIPPNDPTETTTEAPLIVFDEVIEGVMGCTVMEYRSGGGGGGGGGGTRPIAGGVLCSGMAMNTPDGDGVIDNAISALPPGGETGEVAGERQIEPIDCTGLTGESCCLLVKLKVRDHDIHGNAIQCTLNYIETTKKKKYWKNLRGKKVHIFANHNGIVNKVPKIVGDWPQGITGQEFEDWLLEAGSPPLILQQ